MLPKELVITFPKKHFTILHLLSEKVVSVLSVAGSAYTAWETMT